METERGTLTIRDNTIIKFSLLRHCTVKDIHLNGRSSFCTQQRTTQLKYCSIMDKIKIKKIREKERFPSNITAPIRCFGCSRCFMSQYRIFFLLFQTKEKKSTFRCANWLILDVPCVSAASSNRIKTGPLD